MATINIQKKNYLKVYGERTELINSENVFYNNSESIIDDKNVNKLETKNYFKEF